MLRRPFGVTCKSLCDNRLTIFRVVKMPTLKMVNSLLLSDLLVALNVASWAASYPRRIAKHPEQSGPLPLSMI